MEAILEIQGLCKRYADFQLSDISLSMAPGTITGLVGANGAGKSTTIKLILNLIRRDAGSIRVFGRDNLAEEAAVKERIGVVFDEPCFHDLLTPLQISGYMRGLYGRWDETLFRRYLSAFSLPEKKPVKDFSRGMKMKLSIAAAMSHGAELLILDEPTSGLDPLVRDEILDIFLEFLQEESHAILLSSHITSDLDKIADAVTFLHEGHIVLSATRDDLMDAMGVARVSASQLTELQGGEALRVRREKHGCTVLVKDRRSVARRHPNWVVEGVSIEEMMLLIVRGETV